MVLVPVMAIVLLIMSNSPPGFPLDPRATPVDCQYVSPIAFTAENSRINATIFVEDFVQFPDTTALHMMRILTRNQDVAADFSISNFWDIEHNGSNISFCILHPIGGTVSAALMCGHRVLAELKHQISNIDAYPVGWTRMYNTNDAIVRVADICFSNNTFHYFAQPNTIAFPLVTSYNHTITHTIHHVPAAHYQHGNKEYKIHSNPVVFISARPDSLWRQLVDVLIPLWATMAFYERPSEYEVLLTQNQIELIPNLKFMISTDILLNDTLGCYGNGYFAKAPGGKSIDENLTIYNDKSEAQLLAEHLAWVMAARPSLIAPFKQMFVTYPLVSNKVILDAVGELYREQLERLYPDLVFERLPETVNMQEMANAVAEARIFIGGHISSLAFGVFMYPEAFMIEIQPNGLECSAFAQKFAQMSGAGYASMHTGKCKVCTFDNLTCYLDSELKYRPISDKNLKAVIDHALLRH